VGFGFVIKFAYFYKKYDIFYFLFCRLLDVIDSYERQIQNLQKDLEIYR